VAENRVKRLVAKLDDHWFSLRLQTDPDLGGNLGIHPAANMPVQPTVTTVAKHDVPQVKAPVAPKMTKAAETYLRLKGRDRPKTFHRSVQRTIQYFTTVCGDKLIHEYQKVDVNRFRDWLMKKGMAGSSIQRTFGAVKAVLNFALDEAGLPPNPAFTKVYIDTEAGVIERQPVSDQALKIVQARCRETDDERRWLVALISDTGLRLAEAAGLLREDIHLKPGEVPFIRVRPHSWRRLKTKSSERDVPLVGAALWAAERIVDSSSEGPFAFPSYNKSGSTNANSASAALNKWMKTLTKEDYTVHGFRHAMRDRLRAVECPSELVDSIGGWTTEGVEQSYGKGYPIAIRHKWMLKLE
jgi:integrase